MNNKNEILRQIGVSIPTILLPNREVNLEKWAVVACDQFTSELDYWNDVECLTQNVPSTYHIILPEAFLESPDKQSRIDRINQEMKKYIEDKIVVETVNGFILVQRKLKNNSVRTGLMISLDLDAYDYKPGSKTIIRATEKTVLERIPPRVQIRVNAPIEVPHIMVLIDDPSKSVIEPIIEMVKNEKTEPIYETNLMKGGGSIQGFAITDENKLEQIGICLQNIMKKDNFLFAVGDGNHSLATAKQCWENIKVNISEEDKKNHPARFTLVEINNIYDDGLLFEPIHRVLFNVNQEEILSFISGNGPEVLVVLGNESKRIHLKERNSHLVVGILQILLDEYLAIHPEVKIDYIHGESALRKLTVEKDSLGFLLSSMDKHDLFKTVEMDGALPRKTFSMGEAEEKRYYMECRKIK